LVACAAPVRRLPPPPLRALLWLGFAVLILALLAIEHGLRADLAERPPSTHLCGRLAAAAITGILSAIAAFQC
jgi:hypothetical protein